MRLRQAALVLISAFAAACGAPADVDWPVNGGEGGRRYSSLTQITPDNVGQLQVAWTYDSGDAFEGSEMQSNPIVVGGTLYATTPTLKVVALDAATGALRWSFDPIEAAGLPRSRARHRGVTVHDDRVLVVARSFLWALDRTTGQPIATFGKGGRVDLREGLGRPADRMSVSASSPGVVFEGIFIVGTSVPETLPGTPGHIRAFDVGTGEQRPEDEEEDGGHEKRPQHGRQTVAIAAHPLAQALPGPGRSGDQRGEDTDGSEQDGRPGAAAVQGERARRERGDDGEERGPLGGPQCGHDQQGQTADTPDEGPRARASARPAAGGVHGDGGRHGDEDQVDRHSLAQQEHAEQTGGQGRPQGRGTDRCRIAGREIDQSGRRGRRSAR